MVKGDGRAGSTGAAVRSGHVIKLTDYDITPATVIGITFTDGFSRAFCFTFFQA